MTDESIQSLARRAISERDPRLEHRRWLELARHGRVSAEARLLVERVLRGEVAREQITLAAYAGHPPALALVEEEIAELVAFLDEELGAACVVFSEDVTWADVAAWFGGLSRWRTAPLHAARLALARLLLVEAIAAPPSVGAAIDAAERFVAHRKKRDATVVVELLVTYERQYDYPYESVYETPGATGALLVTLAQAVEHVQPRRVLPLLVVEECEYRRVSAIEAARVAKRAVATLALR